MLTTITGFNCRRANGRPSRDYSPASAANSFADALSVNVILSPHNTTPSSDTFRVYYTPPHPPTDDADASGGGNGVVFVCVHGAGYSGLSWAAFANQITKQSNGKVGVLAYDARAHGKSQPQWCSQTKGSGADFRGPLNPTPLDLAGKSAVDQARDGPPDLSLNRLSADLVSLLKTMFPVRAEAPSLVLVGHSMVSCAALVGSLRKLTVRIRF